MNVRLSEYVRKQFPALKRSIHGYPIAYLDGPGGYQVPDCVIRAVESYLIDMNANVGIEFDNAIRTRAMLQNAREVFADFFHCNLDEVVFGANMTTLNFSLAQALVRDMKTGDKVLITEIDHEANRGPWLQLQDRGIRVEEVRLDEHTCTLDMEDLKKKLTPGTKVVAANYACNGVGTISDVHQIVEMAHAVGAVTIIDAVHYAAHGPIDVQKLKTDFLLCSAYKFFGPHIGILYGKKDVLSKLRPMNLRTQKQYPPQMMETGTLHHEGIAGAIAAIEFIADIGLKFGDDFQTGLAKTRRDQIVAGLMVFEHYELELCRHLIDALTLNNKITLYGPSPGYPRTSTVSFTYAGYTPIQIATYLGRKGLFVWAGDFYAARLVERLGLKDKGGLIRVGIAPYNTEEELDRLIEALKDEASIRESINTLQPENVLLTTPQSEMKSQLG